MREGVSQALTARATPKEGETEANWDGINEQYERFSASMDQLYEFNSGFFSIISLYTQTFAVFKVKTSLLPSLCHSTLEILEEVSHFNLLMKKHSEKVSAFNGDKDRLKRFLDSFSRSLSWFLGMTAYKLIKVKDEKDQEKKEKEAKDDNKMQDLIIQSNLLSGGIENRYISLFSQDGLDSLHDLIQISNDHKLLQLVSQKPSQTEDDKLISSVIHKGENVIVDKLIAYLQGFLERKIPMCTYARLGGEDGMRLTRASFGVMIKFSEFYDSFTQMVDNVDMEWSMLEGDDERDIKMKEMIKAMPHYDMIFKRWESAAKMRQWINEKKTNLSQKVQKEVEAEYKKKKEQAPKEEKPAEAPVVEEKKEEPIKEDEIILIDTTSKPAEPEAPKPTEGDEAKKEDSQGFTEADKEAIQELVDKKFIDELQSIFTKIVEKADFLVKLQVPASYLFKDPNKKKEGHLIFIKDHSRQQDAEGNQQPQPEYDWKDRLKSWRQMQTSKGAIKSYTDRKKEIFDSSVMSVLACLQSPINTQRIKKQVETVFINASKRIAGLKLLGHMMNLELP